MSIMNHLLDDSVRYANQMSQAGGSVELHTWDGMLHVFSSNITTLEAARAAMRGIGEFLARHLLDIGDASSSRSGT